MNTMTFAVLLIGVNLTKVVYGVTLEPLPPTPMATRSGIPSFLQNVTAPPCTTVNNASIPLTRNGMVDGNLRWAVFLVYLDPAFNDHERSVITDALWHLWRVIPCVPFAVWPRGGTPSGDYLHVIKGTNSGCSSSVGRMGGVQYQILQSPDCSYHQGIIMHEMMHALGIHHEQCRPDRDFYVDIHWGNIYPGYEGNFDKFPYSMVSTFGVPYNYQSIMHYHATQFSRNGHPTITAKTGEPVSSFVLQETDKLKLRRMYGC